MARRWKDHSTISSQIGEWLTTSLISLNIWMWDRWKWLNEKKSVEAKDWMNLNWWLYHYWYLLLRYQIQIGEIECIEAIHWYSEDILTTVHQFKHHYNSSFISILQCQYQLVRIVQTVFCSVSINHNLLFFIHIEQLESMWIQPLLAVLDIESSYSIFYVVHILIFSLYLCSIPSLSTIPPFFIFNKV